MGHGRVAHTYTQTIPVQRIRDDFPCDGHCHHGVPVCPTSRRFSRLLALTVATNQVLTRIIWRQSFPVQYHLEANIDGIYTYVAMGGFYASIETEICFRIFFALSLSCWFKRKQFMPCICRHRPKSAKRAYRQNGRPIAVCLS